MADNDIIKGAPSGRVVVTEAYAGDAAPGPLSVAIVSLVELCQHAMPNPRTIREKLAEARFAPFPAAKAAEYGRTLALESKLLAGQVRNLRHELYIRDRNGELVVLILSEANADEGPVVFLSALFAGATEADVVKAAKHVTKLPPAVGGMTKDADGKIVRRIFWDIPGTAGIRTLIASGPENMEVLDQPRALIAVNKAS